MDCEAEQSRKAQLRLADLSRARGNYACRAITRAELIQPAQAILIPSKSLAFSLSGCRNRRCRALSAAAFPADLLFFTGGGLPFRRA